MKDNDSKFLFESFVNHQASRKLYRTETLDSIVLRNILEDNSDLFMQEGIWDTIKTGAQNVGQKVMQGAQNLGNKVMGGAVTALDPIVRPYISQAIANLTQQEKETLAKAAQQGDQALSQAISQVADTEGAKKEIEQLNKAPQGTPQGAATTVATDPAASVAGFPGTPVNASTEITLGDYVSVYESYINELKNVCLCNDSKAKLEESLNNVKLYIEGKESDVILEFQVNPATGAAPGQAAPVDPSTEIMAVIQKHFPNAQPQAVSNFIKSVGGQPAQQAQQGGGMLDKAKAGISAVKNWFSKPENQKKSGKILLGMLAMYFGGPLILAAVKGVLGAGAATAAAGTALKAATGGYTRPDGVIMGKDDIDMLQDF